MSKTENITAEVTPVNDTENGVSVFKILGVLLGFGSLYLISKYFGGLVHLELIEHTVKQAGPLAPALYMSFYLIAPTILFPASVLTMAGGVMFGPIWGTLYTIISATIGATIPFLVTRKFGRKPLEKLLSKYDNFDRRFQTFEQDVAKDGWKYVAFTRLVTFFPFLILNYAFGLTRIKLWTYVWASFVFMLPGSLMFTYMGYAGKEALGGSEDSMTKISIAIGFFIFFSTLPRLVKRIRKQGNNK